ncbi:hypothetical protein GWI33_004656 [Rhynchophorus ferrugineus]|uniref:Uncharacterized protein n=1 Tax=Rhynchophorus ferrugineus TaxID=354439 RepID=A0A834MMX8_RHYFE|nr:hypothetical protein GWI33_004656 [Rhynchophorus ferrugineus]
MQIMQNNAIKTDGNPVALDQSIICQLSEKTYVISTETERVKNISSVNWCQVCRLNTMQLLKSTSVTILLTFATSAARLLEKIESGTWKKIEKLFFADVAPSYLSAAAGVQITVSEIIAG